MNNSNLGKQKYNFKAFYDDFGAYYRIEDLETGEIVWRWNTLVPEDKKIGIIISSDELENQYKYSLRKEKLETLK